MPAAASLKVLIVDDQESVREVTRITLQQLGIQLIYDADNGNTGLQALMRQPIDLVISDFNMPGLDGIGMLRAIRANPHVRRLPFILLTGRGDKELVVKAAQAGVNNYLVKPFDATILRTKIEQVMGKLS
ncbi:MAG: response regulator [Xanthobacteraceae bacterium]|jgi:two-component system chemotaxis response regulator CheY